MKMNQITAIRKKLIEDKESTNEELIEHFVNIVGIPEKMAKEFMACRNAYQTHPAFKNEKQQS